MTFADTHTHLYLEDFDEDREEELRLCEEAGVRHLFFPNINMDSLAPMLRLCSEHPHCHPMIGLHPSEVKEDYETVLAEMMGRIGEAPFAGIGEIGMDLYWDKSFAEEQKKALHAQLLLSQERDLPAVIHCRKAFAETWEVIRLLQGPLRGVFHCFAGDTAQARLVISRGFMIGVGGVVTYKNSGLQEVVRNVDIRHILLETDAPFLPPVPYRGKRNASHYIPLIAQRVAELKNLPLETVAEATTANAKQLFGDVGEDKDIR
ncbi:MAG: TatD family hydrolase [Bacteroidales bacterium]|nr:TatD family hydrolase [Bacteroidales bacterium]